jgi:predicted hotdog family 3-hydroxylacyl-ACP dehydratase
MLMAAQAMALLAGRQVPDDQGSVRRGLLNADRRHPFLDAHAEDGLGERGNLRGPAYYN